MGATGTATLDFGAFPGTTDASVNITGQTGIVAGSLVEAWICPVATADHTADEHWVEELKVLAGNIVAGTGFTIYGMCTNEQMEPTAYPVSGKPAFPRDVNPNTGRVNRLYGQWTIAWVWN
jgi:hypothetical protein